MNAEQSDDYDLEIQREGAARFAIEEAKLGDTKYLVSMLREPGPVPDLLKQWLAELFDPGAELDVAAKIQRRRPGKPPRVVPGVVLAAHDVVAKIEATSKLEALITEAIEKHSLGGKRKISRTSVFNYLSSRWPTLAKSFKAAKRSTSDK